MNIKLLFIPLLLFSSQIYAETIHLGILNTSGVNVLCPKFFI